MAFYIDASHFINGYTSKLAGTELGEGTTAGDVLARIPEAAARVSEGV